MRLVLLLGIAALASAAPSHRSDATESTIGGYALVSAARNGRVVGMDEIAALAENAASLPIN